MSVGLEPLRREGSWGLERSVFMSSFRPPVQDFHSLATYLSQNTSAMFLDTISDFHLLLFLVTNEVMPLQVGSECAASWQCAGGGVSGAGHGASSSSGADGPSPAPCGLIDGKVTLSPSASALDSV